MVLLKLRWSAFCFKGLKENRSTVPEALYSVHPQGSEQQCHDGLIRGPESEADAISIRVEVVLVCGRDRRYVQGGFTAFFLRMD